MPPAVTQMLKMLSADAKETFQTLRAATKNLIFFAVSDHDGVAQGGQHWSTLIFSRKDGAFYCMDSLGAMNQQATEKLKEIVARSLDFPNAPLIKLPSVQQPNGFDCGVYVLANVEMVRHFYAVDESVRNVPMHDRQVAANKRQELVAIVNRLIIKQKASAASSLAGNDGDEKPARIRVKTWTPLLFFREKLRQQGNELSL